MTTFIPSKATKKYSAANQSDLFGNLVRTKNLNFNKKGYLSLARKPYVLANETQDADLQVPICIATDDSVVYIITSDHAFTLGVSLADGTPTERLGGTPPNFGFSSDYAFFTADIHVSGTQTVGSLNGSTWTERITGLSSSYPHPMCVSEHQQYLAVGNGNSVRLYDAAYSLITTCTVPAAQIVTWIRWRGNILYFGTRNIFGGEAKMYLWNGSGTAANAGYGVGCEWTMSACEHEDSIVIVNALGQFLRFAGNGFTQLRADDGSEVNFPIYYGNVPWGSSASTSNLIGKVASRGMVASGRKIFIVADGSTSFTNGSTPTQSANFPSGLYCFDPGIGLYHQAGIDHQLRNMVTPTSVTADVLLLPSAQIFETGDPVYVTAVGSLTGDIDTIIYYAIKVDSTHLKLALTPQQAVAGANITITGTATSSNIIFNVYKTVGATYIGNAGPVHIMTKHHTPLFSGSKILFGGETENSTGTSVGAIMSLGMGRNVGYFITPKIQAENVTDVFKKLIAKFPPLNIASRKIIIKYRKEMQWGVPGRGAVNNERCTWINSNSFTINPKLYNMYSVQVGDEVEFTSRAAAGYTAHISAITVNSATDWTITLDESMPDVTAADTSSFGIDNWTKYKTISTTDDLKAATKGLKNMALAENAKWVQLKVELRGYADMEDDTVDMEEVMFVTGADQKYA